MKGLTCRGFATRSEPGWKVNITLSPQGVFVTCHQLQEVRTVLKIYQIQIKTNRTQSPHLSNAHFKLFILFLYCRIVAVVNAERVLLVAHALGYRQETPSSAKAQCQSEQKKHFQKERSLQKKKVLCCDLSMKCGKFSTERLNFNFTE